MRANSRRGRLLACAFLSLSGGCAGVQSALEPAGVEAERIGVLFWAMTLFCTIVFVGVFTAAAVALFGSSSWRGKLANDRLIVLAGIAFPIAALSLLLGYGVYVMGVGNRIDDDSGLRFSSDDWLSASPGAGTGLRIAVSGERWWWRVFYLMPDGRRIASANELRLPTGQAVPVLLTSADVLHSFWAPKLAGKLDMIPGRVNTLTLNVTEPGVSRGQCAEYCGGAHAFMAFFVVAMPPEKFSAWLSREAGEAAAPDTQDERAGQALFMTRGCAGCHTIRGTGAHGVIGPDLTHVGSRRSLAGGILPNNADAFARWIRDNQHIKPENLMPPFEIFTDRELADLAVYLESLE